MVGHPAHGKEAQLNADAPDFTLSAHTGERVSLRERLVEGRVLLVFYPFAFSSVCGSEMDALKDLHPAFLEAGTEVLAVSVDSKFTLAAYAEDKQLPFPLLADFWPHGHVAQRYGVFDDATGMARRGAFLIEPDGKVSSEISAEVSQQRDFSQFLTS